VLRTWDRVAQHRRLSGIGGLDCHARKLPLAGIEMFPYEDMFRTIRTHVFVSADGERGERDYLDAIRDARCFVANDYLADSKGARFWAECGCGARIDDGERHACHEEVTLRLALPVAADIRIVRNGKLVASMSDNSIGLPATAPGVYRAEAWLGGRPWVYTNHIGLMPAPRGGGIPA
jgi:hypothetical protein